MRHLDEAGGLPRKRKESHGVRAVDAVYLVGGPADGSHGAAPDHARNHLLQALLPRDDCLEDLQEPPHLHDNSKEINIAWAGF